MIQQAHDKLGHDYEARVRKMAEYLGWDLVKGSLNPCEACAMAKAKQKNINKDKKIEIGEKEDDKKGCI